MLRRGIIFKNQRREAEKNGQEIYSPPVFTFLLTREFHLV